MGDIERTVDKKLRTIKKKMNGYAHLHAITNFTFLTGASHPQELVERAHQLHYSAIAITDECSLAGIVKAYTVSKILGIHLIVGSRFVLSNNETVIVIAPTKEAYAELSGFITLTRRRSPKGEYEAHLADMRFRLQNCLIIWLPTHQSKTTDQLAEVLTQAFKNRLWIGLNHIHATACPSTYTLALDIAKLWNIPTIAAGAALMHKKSRKPLQDTLTAIKHNSNVQTLSTQLQTNAEAYLKSLSQLHALYPIDALEQTVHIANACTFCLSELSYQYPQELVPKGYTPTLYLKHLVDKGKQQRYPQGVPNNINTLINKELTLIHKMHYEYYFLTVYDIVAFAKKQNILCQGRGSAANSVVCYCLFITEISPTQINVLFERFISEERDEPPDIDVDFEHERREEVIQYIYNKYGRERAALAATVITYRSKSAIRDVGKALGLDNTLIEYFLRSLAWWDRTKDLQNRIQAAGLEPHKKTLLLFFKLVEQILGFPRHLSQHVGGFIIAQDKVSHLVPLENAAMPERTIIQWDKEDLEAMHLLKVDVLALGMLSALRKGLEYVHAYDRNIKTLASIPAEDKLTYDMLCRGDSLGVFQVESRAQMSMLPRLRPQTFYDLVIEIAIVRPGPIQGDMVHPYLQRRAGLEPVTYYNDALKDVLETTLGIPIFQEQAIRLAMVAAGFSGGKADELRRAMASWGKNGNLLKFEISFIEGMLNNGYPKDFAERLFEQIKGFGGYGFPESHSASFALLCYASSWLKCHHPAAFYCALLNSQPMGFYSPSQLIQDARRHHVTVHPVDINASQTENHLVPVINVNHNQHPWAIRLGFNRIKGLNLTLANNIVITRPKTGFQSLEHLLELTEMGKTAMEILAGADALTPLCGNRHQAHWQASSIEPQKPLLSKCTNKNDKLETPAPTEANNVLLDYNTTGLSLRAHPMALLRQVAPFNRCKTSTELTYIGHGRPVHIAGLVTGRQRPGTAKGTVFLTLEDETGNINVIVWKRTQDHFRAELLNAKLLYIKGVVEISTQHTQDHTPVVHVVAGHLLDCSKKWADKLQVSSRNFH